MDESVPGELDPSRARTTVAGPREPGHRPVRISPDLLYIEPVSACNLRCRMCYGNVLNGTERRVLAAEVVLDFVRRYLAVAPRPAVISWCGTGEIFLHPDFPRLVDGLLAEYGEDALAMQVQTNGTIRRLREFASLRRLDFRVSVDGLRPVHEWNRGGNTYERTLSFCREAVDLGCRSLVIRTLLTHDSISCLDEFQEEVRQRVGPGVEVWLIVPYTNREVARLRPLTSCVARHPLDDGRAVTRAEAVAVLAERYRDRYALDEDPLGVGNYLSLTTEGLYSCCQRIVRLGDASTDVSAVLARLATAADACRACPIFPCA